jgi:hypothetical protein
MRSNQQRVQCMAFARQGKLSPILFCVPEIEPNLAMQTIIVKQLLIGKG